ncbi:hypothetical protein CRUP_014262 [Coryphaenoides rupestris]|nr:hypothetical protein CRUP_014262 [Coryphaenoides rupestris]
MAPPEIEKVLKDSPADARQSVLKRLLGGENSKATFKDSDLDALIQSNKGNMRVSQPLRSKEEL